MQTYGSTYLSCKVLQFIITAKVYLHLFYLIFSITCHRHLFCPERTSAKNVRNLIKIEASFSFVISSNNDFFMFVSVDPAVEKYVIILTERSLISRTHCRANYSI